MISFTPPQDNWLSSLMQDNIVPFIDDNEIANSFDYHLNQYLKHRDQEQEKMQIKLMQEIQQKDDLHNRLHKRNAQFDALKLIINEGGEDHDVYSVETDTDVSPLAEDNYSSYDAGVQSGDENPLKKRKRETVNLG